MGRLSCSQPHLPARLSSEAHVKAINYSSPVSGRGFHQAAGPSITYITSEWEKLGKVALRVAAVSVFYSSAFNASTSRPHPGYLPILSSFYV